jgi:hypothetical protein
VVIVGMRGSFRHRGLLSPAPYPGFVGRAGAGGR